jgi:hypothetical protein
MRLNAIYLQMFGYHFVCDELICIPIQYGMGRKTPNCPEQMDKNV